MQIRAPLEAMPHLSPQAPQTVLPQYRGEKASCRPGSVAMEFKEAALLYSLTPLKSSHRTCGAKPWANFPWVAPGAVRGWAHEPHSRGLDNQKTMGLTPDQSSRKLAPHLPPANAEGL